MASLLLKRTDTIISVKCACNIPKTEQKMRAEQKMHPEQKIGNGVITFKTSHVALCYYQKEFQLQNWDSFFSYKKEPNKQKYDILKKKRSDYNE